MVNYKYFIITIGLFINTILSSNAQTKPKTEEDYYKILTFPIPEDVELEVGGLAVLPDGNVAVSTRRGEVWLIKNPYQTGVTRPIFKQIGEGLHEALGLNYINDKLITTQRGEVTILEDLIGDEVIDSYKAFYKWPLSGNYHQYSYGPVLMPNNDMLFTLNVDWIGKGGSLSKWRGWMIRLTPDGKIIPWATGLRSPAGFNVNTAGDIFYTENQGDWVGSGRMTHLEEGDFAGNVAGLNWADEPNSPVKLRLEDIPDTGETLYEASKKVKGIKAPAVWFPHTLMGISTSDILELKKDDVFGPFKGQMFVGDQGHSKIMRVNLEKVNGIYQGACFPFREGFNSGILRMVWGLDNSMLVGMTSRGWASTGKQKFGLQRLVWTGETPFEIATILSSADGFILNFTQPVDKTAAVRPENYSVQSFNYKYHHYYGSPIINNKTLKLKAIKVSEDGMQVRISLDSLRKGYIHEIKLNDFVNREKQPLLHNFGYFTLNEINDNEPALDLNKYAIKAKEMHADHMKMEVMPAKESVKRQTTVPSEWNNKIDQTLTIGTKPGLKFDITNIQVKAGSNIRLVFENNDDMLHNLLIVKPGTVDKVGQTAQELGLEGSALNYVPILDEVLFHTGILEPETSETIYFKAPTQKGKYTFVCTFPGHYTLMQGTITVR